MSRSTHLSPLFRMISLRDMLDLLAMLRDFREPLSTPGGLRQTIDLLLILGESFGLDPALLAKLRSIADDPRAFEIALAVLRYAMSFINQPSQATIGEAESKMSVQSLSFSDWLALLMQLLELLRSTRKPINAQ